MPLTVYSNCSERLYLALRTSRNEARLHTRAKSNFPPRGGGGIYIGLYNQFVNSIPIRAFRINSILSIRLIWNAKQFNSIRASSEGLKGLPAPLTTPGALLPPLEAPVLPPREAHQGILGYENHPMYDYLARSQARNWPYHQLVDVDAS